MRPALLTRDDLSRTLGEIDDVSAAELLAIGATLTELETAMRLVEHERTDEEAETPSVHVAHLVDVLRQIAETNEPEYLGTD
jgi:hypothetical protein